MTNEERLKEIEAEKNELQEKLSHLYKEEWDLTKAMESYYIGIVSDYDSYDGLVLLGRCTKEKATKWTTVKSKYDETAEVFEVSEKEYEKYRNAWKVCKAKELVRGIDGGIYCKLDDYFKALRENLEHYFNAACEANWEEN